VERFFSRSTMDPCARRIASLQSSRNAAGKYSARRRAGTRKPGKPCLPVSELQVRENFKRAFISLNH
jgi:hypothetical protein